MKTKFKMFESNNKLTLYHGSTEPQDFDDFNILFLSENIVFSEEYGKFLYEVTINPTNIFDSTDYKQMEELFEDNDGELYDPYNEEYITFDEYKNGSYMSDTWEMIEYLGVESFGNYDCIIITEGGSNINYIIWDTKLVVSVKDI
jgi:hypothetical protein